jgi:hypothetical protein
MDFKSKIEGFTTKQAIHLILELLGNISDENLIRLTYLGEKLTSDDEVLAGMAGVRRLLQDPKHPAKILFRRVLDYLPKQNIRILFETLFYQAWFLGGKKREEFEAEHGFRPPFIMILSPTLHCNLRCKGCYTLGYHNPNHPRPCMIIDNPHVMRELIEEIKPYFTHPGAEEIYSTKSHEMDSYARDFAQLANGVWESEYIRRQDESRVEEVQKFKSDFGKVQRDLSTPY